MPRPRHGSPPACRSARFSKRMGHSVETLVSTYVGALDGDESLANDRIDEVLGSEVK